MKKFKNTVFLVLSLLLTHSCSQPDCPSHYANNQPKGAGIKISTKQLELGLSVQGGINKNGKMPLPFGNLEIAMGFPKKNAYLNTGLNLGFSSNSPNLAGVYLTFEDANGFALDSYFDIPIASFIKFYTSENLEEDNYIRIDFNDEIPSGTFDYKIATYDTKGNISQPITGTITVENIKDDTTTENYAFIGNWKLDIATPNILNSKPNTITVKCTSGDKLTNDEFKKETLNRIIKLHIQQDNSFSLIDFKAAEYLNIKETSTSCQSTYSKENENHIYSGNWAFNTTKNTLSLVVFKKETIRSQFPEDVKTETYEKGKLLLFDAVFETENNNLNITSTSPSEVIDFKEVKLFTFLKS